MKNNLSEGISMEKEKWQLVWDVGRDSEGTVVTGNLSELHTLLITGMNEKERVSGIDSVLQSIISGRTPEEVELLLIDISGCLKLYDNSPYLRGRMIDNTEEAVFALKGMFYEIRHRHMLMGKVKALCFEDYKQKEDRLHNHGGTQGKMKQTVIVVSDLADLLKQNKEEAEESFVRIAQLGRQSGIHLLAASSNTSLEVLSGLIMANMCNCISYKLPTAVDSRSVIETAGAEKLSGNSDFFYKPGWDNKAVLLQGV